jgi:hypothetical protein
MKVENYESKYELPKEQKDALKKFVHDKTGMDEDKIVITSTGKIQAVLNDSEMWLMLEATLGEGGQRGAQNVRYAEVNFSNGKDSHNWITKAFVLFRIKGPDTGSELSDSSINVLGTSTLGSKDMEDFLHEISYKAQKTYGCDEDIEIELKVTQPHSSYMVLFLLVWKKSSMNKFSK